MPGILFYGDPHGVWQPLLDAVVAHRPEAVVILGDFGLDAPIRDKLAPVWPLVPAWRWIIGNHDTDSDELYDRATAEPEGDLHGRVESLAGARVAGLSGVFKASVWYPRLSADPEDESAVFDGRRDMLRSTRRADRWRDGLPRRHRATIFPEDFSKLKRLRADVLVSHEGPSCHRHGFAGLDDLARDMRVRLVVHGHHHEAYQGETRDGIAVRGLGLAEPWLWDGGR